VKLNDALMLFHAIPRIVGVPVRDTETQTQAQTDFEIGSSFRNRLSSVANRMMALILRVPVPALETAKQYEADRT
jgi:hypothetical protein